MKMNEFINTQNNPDKFKDWSVIHRPLRFRDVVGNDFHREILQESIRNGVLPAYLLLSGQAGISKSTLALITALSLQCKNLDDGEPCLECDNCTEIMETLIFDDNKQTVKSACNVTIFNMSIKSGKQNAEDIIEIMNYAPSSEYPYNVIILEEPQEMSTGLQNSLLQNFEYIPRDTHIILCTTGKDRLREDFLSRATVIDLEPPSVEDIVHLLEDVAVRFNVNIPTDRTPLRLIARHKRRIPRDAVKTFQLLAETGSINIERTHKILGLVETQHYIQFYKAVEGDITEVIDFISSLPDKEVGYCDFLKGLLEFTKDLLKIKYNRNPEKYTKEDMKELRKIADSFTYKDFIILNQYMALLTVNDESKAEAEIMTLAFKMTEQTTLAVLENVEQNVVQENKKNTKEYTENKTKEAIESTQNTNVYLKDINDIINILNTSQVSKK